jgi:exodeoxyribonuclease VII small subunit
MSKIKKMNFQESINRVDEIITLLEEKSVSIEDSLSLYEEAINLINSCHVTLESIEGKVKKISNKDTNAMEDLDV